MMKRRLFMIMCLLLTTVMLTVSGADSTPAEESEETAESKRNSAMIVISDDLKEADTSSGEIRGGTNQDDAVLLPMNTKLYGTVSDSSISWFAFTTGDTADATYTITTVNKSSEAYDLVTIILDESGETLTYEYAGGKEGIASTIYMSELSSNTTYYLQIRARDYQEDTIHYMITIKEPETSSTAYKTTENLSEARGVNAALEREIYPGTNQDDAAFIPSRVKLSGTVSDSVVSWYAFTTGSVENETCSITTINKSVGAYDLVTVVYDELGKRFDYKYATNTGTASTINIPISPNTTYYVLVRARDYRMDTIDYTLSIKTPEEPQDDTTTLEQLAEESLVFETPFELTETQVMFVVNQAVFIDENAVKEALKPIADVILEHPDHSILLAGTTATDNTQEFCVDLSNRRAAAVKDVLVNTFGVPEEQLLTVGLGYEADPFVRGKDRDANGDFVETEGAKNRRVVVLDAEDPIAQELLGQ